jgi:hypothetical protein
MKTFIDIFNESNDRPPAWVGAERWANLQNAYELFNEQISKKGKSVYHASFSKLIWDSNKQSNFGFFVSVNPQFCVDFFKYYCVGSKKFGIQEGFFYKFYLKKHLNIFNPMSDKDIASVSDTLDPLIKKTFEKRCLQVREKNRLWEEIEKPFIYENVKKSNKFDGYISFGTMEGITNPLTLTVLDEFIEKYGIFTEANNFALFEPQKVLKIVSEEQHRISI